MFSACTKILKSSCYSKESVAARFDLLSVEDYPFGTPFSFDDICVECFKQCLMTMIRSTVANGLDYVVTEHRRRGGMGVARSVASLSIGGGRSDALNAAVRRSVGE